MSILYYIFALCLIQRIHSSSVPIIDEAALRECGNLLNINIHHWQNPNATFENGHCLVKCYENGQLHSKHSLNEGFNCPTNSSGICHNGKCVSESSEAINECGYIHRFNFSLVNYHGTKYINKGCKLECIVDDKTISKNNVNDGLSCPEQNENVCINGECKKNPNSHTTTTTEAPINIKYQLLEVNVIFFSVIMNADFFQKFNKLVPSEKVFLQSYASLGESVHSYCNSELFDIKTSERKLFGSNSCAIWISNNTDVKANLNLALKDTKNHQLASFSINLYQQFLHDLEHYPHYTQSPHFLLKTGSEVKYLRNVTEMGYTQIAINYLYDVIN